MISICFQGKYMDIEFDFKGDPVGGVITKCKHCQSVSRINLFFNVV